MGGRHDAHALPAREQVDGQARARVRLTRPGWALDHERAGVEATDLRAETLEILAAVQRRRPGVEARGPAGEEIGAGVEHAARLGPTRSDAVSEPEERTDLLIGAVRAAGREPGRRGAALSGAAAVDEPPRRLVDRADRAALVRVGVVAPTLAQLVLLLGEGERPLEAAAADRFGPVDDRKLPDRVAVLVAELRSGHLAPREVRPPRRLVLAPVVPEEVEGRAARALLRVVLGLIVGQVTEQERP